MSKRGGVRSVSVFPAWGPLAPEDEVRLAEMVRRVIAGDRGAEGEFWLAMHPRIRQWARRVIRRSGGSAALRLGSEAWLLDDLVQEAYPLLVESITSWEGATPVALHLQQELGRGLRRRWHALQGSRRMVLAPRGLPDPAVPFAEDADVLILLDTLLNDLRKQKFAERDLVLLQRRVVFGESIAAAGRAAGMSRTTAQRRWAAVVSAARQLLENEGRGSLNVPE